MHISTVKTYKCDICGTTGPWIKGKWSARVFILDSKRLWDHEFHTCSTECDNKFVMMSKEERKALAKTIEKSL